VTKKGTRTFLLMEDGYVHSMYGVNKAVADKTNSFYPLSNTLVW